MTARTMQMQVPVVALLLVAASAPIHAQPAPAPGTVVSAAGPTTAMASAVGRLEGIPDARARRALVEALDDAHRRGLPLEPLVAKALEGVEKDAPPARIEGAVRAMVGRLASARDALAPAVSDREITAGADAIAVGVPADVLRSMRTLARRRSTAVALGVLAQLVSRGVPVPEAARAVGRLVQRRASDGQLLAVGHAVQEDLSTGIAAITALDMRTRALIAALPAASAPAAAAIAPAAEGASGGRGGKGRP